MRGSQKMVLINPTAFDAFANTYDDEFTHSILGQLLRPRVWEKLAEYFTADQHVLELTCGTGEDAIWLAQRGIHITATDGSPEMVNVARAKAEAAGLRRGSVEVEQVSLQEVVAGYFGGQRPHREASHSVVGRRFDGVFSNFGGLNTIGEWQPLAAALAEIVKPGGIIILVPMGPFCPWEILWYLAHGQLKQAWRRFARNGVSAKIGHTVISIWYPSARRLQADFSLWFRHRRTESLGLWLPPSYLDHFVNKWPGFFHRLNQFEKATAPLTGGWGDHYIIIFERKET